MNCINTKLIFLKLLLFTFYGAIGCLMPFLTLHMQKLGLSGSEITSINSILPLTALIGPPTVGYLADRLGYYKLITICSMFLAAVFHTLLLFVPVSSRPSQDDAFLLLQCDPGGAHLSLQSCGYQCTTKFEYVNTKFRFDECHRICDGPSVEELANSLINDASTASKLDGMADDVRPPHICFHGYNYTNCNVITGTDISINVTRSLHHFTKGKINGTEVCNYPQGSFSTDRESFSNMTCDTGYPHCHIQCKAYEINQSHVLRLPKCVEEQPSQQVTFWVYLIVRVLADLFPAILISLLDAMVLTMVKKYGGDFGRHKMFGLVAVGVFAPLVGWLMDEKLGIYGDYNFSPVFYVFDGLLLVTAGLIAVLPIISDNHEANVVKNLSVFLKNKEFALLLLVMVLLGTMWGYLETFLYLRLSSLGASKLLIGLTVTVGILPSVPFLFNSNTVVSICGYHYLLMTAFIIYCVRFVLFSYITNPWWSLPLEALELFTLNLMSVSAILLANKLAPSSLLATAQGLVWMSHYNIGGSIGIFVGGSLDAVYGTTTVFQGMSVFSATCGAIYFVLYHFVKYRQSRPTYQPPVQQSKQNGAIPNGNYEPLSTNPQKLSPLDQPYKLH